MKALACCLLISVVALVVFRDAVSEQKMSSRADTSTYRNRAHGLFGTGMLPDTTFFIHPPKMPFSANDYVFKFDQLRHQHLTPGEFTWWLIGENYGFENLSFIIGETHPGGGAVLHVHDIEEAHVLLEGSFQYLIGDSTFTVHAPYIAKVPAGMPHAILNVGSKPFNIIGVFPSKRQRTKVLGPNPLRPVDESTLSSDESVSVRAPRATITVDGNKSDWSGLKADVLEITCGAGKLSAEVRYAWNQDYLYILIHEKQGDTTRKEAEDAGSYLNTPSSYDGISFFIDVDNRPLSIVYDNSDFNPWFGFSSTGRSDLFCARSNKYWPHLSGQDAYRTYESGNQEMLKNSTVATSGSQSDNSRVIEVAIRWSDIEANVEVKRLRGNNFPTIKPGLRIGSEPLLLDDEASNQRFLNGSRTARPNGRDTNSRDILLTD